MNRKERALVLIAANGTTIVLMINQIAALNSLNAPGGIVGTLLASSVGAMLAYLALSNASDAQRAPHFRVLELGSVLLFSGSLLAFVLSVANETFFGGRYTIIH